MTVGYYAIPPKPTGRRRGGPRTLPHPFCRYCTARLGADKCAEIDERASPSIVCRGCKRRLRDWL